MPPRRPLNELKSLGSGTGPQTPTPHGAAPCGHDAYASYQGHLLPRATISPAPSA
jgi:hypothetical protein